MLASHPDARPSAMLGPFRAIRHKGISDSRENAGGDAVGEIVGMSPGLGQYV
jgi:hypothetical protein